MTNPIQLERLNTYLNKVMSNEEIKANPRFKESGLKAIARHMRVDVEQVEPMIDELAERLRQEMVEESDDDEPRYTWEDDTFGGITVRDTLTGKEKYLGVAEASSLMKDLDDDTGTDQQALARVMGTEKKIRELPADAMMSEGSIFNFPWRLNESAGFAAARYSGFGQNFRLNVVSVVDLEGNPLDIDPKRLTAIARKYIDEA